MSPAQPGDARRLQTQVEADKMAEELKELAAQIEQKQALIQKNEERMREIEGWPGGGGSLGFLFRLWASTVANFVLFEKLILFNPFDLLLVFEKSKTAGVPPETLLLLFPFSAEARDFQGGHDKQQKVEVWFHMLFPCHMQNLGDMRKLFSRSQDSVSSKCPGVRGA